MQCVFVVHFVEYIFKNYKTVDSLFNRLLCFIGVICVEVMFRFAVLLEL